MREQARSRERSHVVERIRNHLRSNVLGLVAIFIVLGGTAYAVNGPLPGRNTVGSADVINNNLTGKDIREATLNLSGGARAYGVVNPNDCAPVPGTCNVEEPTEGITRVFRTDTGLYCVRAAGIDPENNPAAVSVDVENSEPHPGDAVAMTNTGYNCAGHTDFFVSTQRHPEVTVNQGGSQNNATVSGPAEASNTVGFTIVIP
jgi:hypothetical protein